MRLPNDTSRFRKTKLCHYYYRIIRRKPTRKEKKRNLETNQKVRDAEPLHQLKTSKLDWTLEKKRLLIRFFLF